MVIFSIYIYLIKYGTEEKFEVTSSFSKPKLITKILILIICFTLMTFAANKVLDSSVTIVEALNISSSFFGVIVLGIASALPELMTVLIACWKRKVAISAGVLIGSNITNPMFALGLGAIISTYTVPRVVIFYDLPIKIVTALLIFFMLWKEQIMKKTSGIALIILYLIYIYFRNRYYPVDF